MTAAAYEIHRCSKIFFGKSFDSGLAQRLLFDDLERWTENVQLSTIPPARKPLGRDPHQITTRERAVSSFLGFLGVSFAVIATPGPDTAITIRNMLIGGRAGAF
jgi:hypothetical protein